MVHNRPFIFDNDVTVHKDLTISKNLTVGRRHSYFLKLRMTEDISIKLIFKMLENVLSVPSKGLLKTFLFPVLFGINLYKVSSTFG